MDQGADAPGLGESQNPSPSSSSSSSSAVAADTLVPTKQSEDIANPLPPAQQSAAAAVAVAGAAAAAAAASASQPLPPSRYESQKRRDWNSFLQYLKNHKPSLALSRCSGAHVIEFLKYLDQFGKTKVHAQGCTYFGHPSPPAPCACPLRQAWGSLDALIGRLRAAYEENGGSPDSNLFGANAVRIYLREVRESQEKARGIPYEKKKRKRQTMIMGRTAKESAGSSSAAAAFTEAAADDESSKKAAAAATGALASSEETTKEGEGSDTVPQQRDDLT